MNIYINRPELPNESLYSHLNNKDTKKVFITYLTFNKTTLEWYGGETTLYKHLKGYAGSGPSILNHLKEWKEKLGGSWRDNFICLLDECYESKAEAKSRETELVNDDTRDELCINYLNGGGGWDYGDVFPEEVRKKMSISNIGKSRSEKTKEKISIANTGKTLSDETKEKISIWRTGKKHSGKTKEKISKSHSGKTLSDKTKEKISEMKRDKRFDHLIKMLDDENIQPAYRRHKCLLCDKVLSRKGVSIKHLKTQHLKKYNLLS